MSNRQDSARSSSSSVISVEIFDGVTSLGLAAVKGNTWALSPLELSVGSHSLTARSAAEVSGPWLITVADPDDDLHLVRPTVEEAVLDGDDERLDYYAVGGDIHVIVPTDSLEEYDTVKVYWTGRNIEIGTAVQTVANPPSLEPFIISKYEVIDVIGENASLKYTVRRPPSDVTHESPGLTLIVDGHSYVLKAPLIHGNRLSVSRQPEFNDWSTAAVRCIGGEDDSDTWSSDARAFNSESELSFIIDDAWHTRNRGKAVKFNWSLRLAPDDGLHWMFSQLLRIPTLE